MIISYIFIIQKTTEKQKEDNFMLEVGFKAPEFQLSDQDGNTVNITDFKGQKVLLWFFPKASTPG